MQCYASGIGDTDMPTLLGGRTLLFLRSSQIFSPSTFFIDKCREKRDLLLYTSAAAYFHMFIIFFQSHTARKWGWSSFLGMDVKKLFPERDERNSARQKQQPTHKNKNLVVGTIFKVNNMSRWCHNRHI